MGGDQDMGPVQYEKDEPVFHAWCKWTIDGGRHGIELLSPADYFSMSYYERWLVRLTEISIKTGLVTRAEVESGKPAPGSSKATPPLTAANAEAAAVIRASARWLMLSASSRNRVSLSANAGSARLRAQDAASAMGAST
jgi:nitrile hydratase